MKQMKRSWHHLLDEPFTWIFYCFFQPAKFTREFEVQGFSKRIVPMLRLALPMFLISYLFVLAARGILIAISLVQYPDAVDFLLSTAGYTVLGIVFGMVVGIVFGMVIGIVFAMVVGIVLGMVVGVPGDITFGVAFAIVSGIIGGILLGRVVGIVGGIALGMVIGIVGGITGGEIALGILGGDITFSGLAGTIGMVGGFMVGSAFAISYMLGYYRLPLYLVSGPSALRAYLASRKNPIHVFTYLRSSPLYWDERVYLPLPGLKSTLLIAAGQSVEKTLEEIAFIVAERPRQISAAQAASQQIIILDLETRNDLLAVAHASQRLTEILPQEAGLMNQRLATSLVRLSDASRDAARYCSPLGRQARLTALEDMITNLKKVYPNTASRDVRLNERLGSIVGRWIELARREQEKLVQVPQEFVPIDNPYLPGLALKLRNTLFVGRRDLAQQLEKALNKESRPTFFLNGERRMGKSSTLNQLPVLLGARYLPIFYDLQMRGISSSISTFLGTIAEEIYKVMVSRGMKVRRLEYELLRDTNRLNDAATYHLFDEWLKEIEQTLEQEDRILLLTFDEFEKLEEAGQAKYIDLNLLLDWFRSVIQNRPRLALLFSGVRTIGEMGTYTGINWAGYFVNVQTLKVSFLRPEEAQHLITQPVADFPSEQIFGEGVVEEIIRVTGCHPFMIQAVCSALIENLNADKRHRADIRDVEKAVEQALESWWDTHFRDLWQRTDRDQRICLVTIKSLREGDMRSIIQQSGLDEIIVHRTLQTLRKRDLVLEKNGRYRIAAPIFKEWVERSKYD